MKTTKKYFYKDKSGRGFTETFTKAEATKAFKGERNDDGQAFSTWAQTAEVGDNWETNSSSVTYMGEKVEKKAAAEPSNNNWKELYTVLLKSHNALIEEFAQYKRESVKWSVEDFEGTAEEKGYTITPEKAQEALERMISKHDAEYGICWETIRCYVEEYGEEREPAESHDIDTSREEADFRARQDGSKY